MGLFLPPTPQTSCSPCPAAPPLTLVQPVTEGRGPSSFYSRGVSTSWVNMSPCMENSLAFLTPSAKPLCHPAAGSLKENGFVFISQEKEQYKEAKGRSLRPETLRCAFRGPCKNDKEFSVKSNSQTSCILQFHQQMTLVISGSFVCVL